MKHLNYPAVKWGARAGLAGAVTLAIFFLMTAHEAYNSLGGGTYAVCRIFRDSPVMDAHLTMVMFSAVICSVLFFGVLCVLLRLRRGRGKAG